MRRLPPDNFTPAGRQLFAGELANHPQYAWQIATEP
jgi:hypothetical protein